MVVRHGAALVIAAALLASLAGCGASTPAGTPAKLRVEIVPEGASVYVDDRFVASARRLARRPHALEPGPHQITVKAPGHFPHDVSLDLPPGTTTLRIKLRPVPP